MLPITKSTGDGEQAGRKLDDDGPERRWSLKTAVLFGLGVSLLFWLIILGIVTLLR